MNQDHSDQIMVVVLNDIVKKSLPRMLAIRQKLEEGETLQGSEVDFFIGLLDKLSLCNRDYKEDLQCMNIFACIAHLLFTVVNLALKNEQSNLNLA